MFYGKNGGFKNIFGVSHLATFIFLCFQCKSLQSIQYAPRLELTPCRSVVSQLS